MEINKQLETPALGKWEKYYEEKLYRWASIINSLACIILDGEPTSNDIDLAQDAIEEVLPYLGLNEK